ASVGETLTAIEVYPPSQPDVTAQVTALMATKPDCIFDQPATASFPETIDGIRQGSDPNILVAVDSGAAPLSALTALGSKAQNILIASTGYLPTDAAHNQLFTTILKPDGTKSETLFSWSAFVGLETVKYAAG